MPALNCATVMDTKGQCQSTQSMVWGLCGESRLSWESEASKGHTSCTGVSRSAHVGGQAPRLARRWGGPCAGRSIGPPERWLARGPPSHSNLQDLATTLDKGGPPGHGDHVGRPLWRSCMRAWLAPSAESSMSRMAASDSKPSRRIRSTVVGSQSSCGTDWARFSKRQGHTQVSKMVRAWRVYLKANRLRAVVTSRGR